MPTSMPTSDPVAIAVEKAGGAVTTNPHEAIDILRQDSGPQLVCLDRSQPHSGSVALSTPLTREEKDLIRRVLGGRRQTKILNEILEARGGVEPTDWQRLVVRQMIWLEK